jgi:uncharacterized protein
MIVNSRTGDIVASTIEVADTRETRRQGLLGRESMDLSTALILVPCFSIHTAFMKFPIDVIFIDRDGMVVRIAENLTPWHVAACWGARAVIELAGGCLKGHDVRIGDRLALTTERARAGNVLLPTPSV